MSRAAHKSAAITAYALSAAAVLHKHARYGAETSNREPRALFRLALKWHYPIALKNMPTGKQPKEPMAQPHFIAVEGQTVLTTQQARVGRKAV
jgi:hypothetical protein